MKRGGITQDTPDVVSTSSLSLMRLPDVLQRHIASFCTPTTLTKMLRLSKWTLCSPAWNLSKCRLFISEDRLDTDFPIMPEDVLSIRRWLSRGQGACTSIRVRNFRLELLASAIREDPSLGRQLTELEMENAWSPPSGSELMRVARLMQEDRVPALVKLTVVYDPGRDEDAEGAAALFKCLGRGVCPQLKHFSIRGPPYKLLPWLADALVLRGEVVKEGLASFGFRDPPLYSLNISSEELEATLAKLVQAPCLSKLQKLELDSVALGAWAAAMYLNSIPCTEHIKELRLVSSKDLDLTAGWYEEYNAIDGGRGVEDLVTALAAGRAPLLETLCCHRINVGEGTLSKLCNAISQGGLKHLEKLSFVDCPNAEEVTQLTAAVVVGCPRLQSFDYNMTRYDRNALMAAALRASQHPLPFYKRLILYDNAGLRDIVDALRMNPQGLSAVTSLRIMGCYWEEEEGLETMAPEEVVTLVGRVIDGCTLQEVSIDVEGDGTNARALIAAMSPGGALAGGTRGIHRLCLGILRGKKEVRRIMNATLRALAAGACPQLREAGAEWDPSCTKARVSTKAQDAMVALLAGEAPCSATLHKLFLSAVLDTAHVRQLTEKLRLRKHTAMQLDTIGPLGLDANVEDCMDFLGALALPHVGDKLVDLRLVFTQVTKKKDERELLEMEVARLIREGAWPRLVGRGPEGTWDACITLRPKWGEDEVHEAVKQALEEKRREVEAACM